MLAIAKTESGLATILGHGKCLPVPFLLTSKPKATLSFGSEIAHILARHGAEDLSSGKVLLGLAMLFEVLGLDGGTGVNRLALNYLLS